jgi:D-alanine--(R)-lactate ligase
MPRPRVAFLFGGRSEEHDVSVKSAIEIAANVDTRMFEPVFIGITRAGAWKLCAAPGPDWERGDCRAAVISPDRETRGLLADEGGRYRPIQVDVVFPVLHGSSGEDGSIQGLLELSGIPYVGCDIQSSATCMDKSLAYLVARSAGIETPEFRVLRHSETVDPMDLEYPVFVKPARSGSSFGVSRVAGALDMGAAIAEARRFDDKVLIERAVPGIEVGCAVLGNIPDLLVGEVDQITVREGLFRIHQEAEPEKGSSNAEMIVPARLPPDTRGAIQDTARAIYTALDCVGLARVDMFLHEDGRVILNEVNTLPGFTSYSRYPRMMAAAGLPLSEVIERCIALAMAR